MRVSTMAKHVLLGLLLPMFLAAPLQAGEKPSGKGWKRQNIVFKDVSYDFELRRALGYALSGGADLNECLVTAHAIKEGDGDSWYREWSILASRLHGAAEDALAQGKHASAREAFLRASNYYRAAEFFLHANPADPRIVKTWKLSRDTFRQGARLMDHPVETVRIPYENTTLPGYILRPDQSMQPRKTLIVQTGFDGTGEELYFEVAFFALQRGYTVLIFEGPGQGGALREQHLYFRPDWEKVVTPVVDFALARKEVDPKRVALLGISMGGYLAPRGAAFEHRLAALIANPGSYDMFGQHMPSPQEWKGMEEAPEQTNAALRKNMREDIGFRWWINNGMFTTDKKTPLDFMLFWREFTMKGLAAGITCPTLVIVSDGDHFMSKGAETKLYNELTCPKTLMRFTHAEAATEHCQVGAMGVANQRILDWLDDTLATVK